MFCICGRNGLGPCAIEGVFSWHFSDLMVSTGMLIESTKSLGTDHRKTRRLKTLPLTSSTCIPPRSCEGCLAPEERNIMANKY